jgi:hypothetical protein
MFARIQICHWARTGFLGPVAPFILAQKVVVIRFIYNKRNLGRPFRAPILKLCHGDIRVISYNASNHAGARFWFIGFKGVVACGVAWLVKSSATEFLTSSVFGLNDNPHTAIRLSFNTHRMFLIFLMLIEDQH